MAKKKIDRDDYDGPEPEFDVDLLKADGIPVSVQSELNRLHRIIVSTNAHSFKEWAKDKIDSIHKKYFEGKM